jgi:hypothetical protein
LQPTTVQNVVTYQTVIDVPNPGLKLKPGMTANVNIEIARRANVLRVPNTGLRFRPTAEIFTALGQEPPAGGIGGGAGGGRGRGRGDGAGPDTRNVQPAPGSPVPQPIAAQQQPATEQRPTTQQRAAGEAGQRRESAGAAQGESSGQQITGGRGEGAGGGRRGGGRGNFQERMANMTPEERERFMERMRARGFTPPTDGDSATTLSRGGRGQGPRTADAGQRPRPTAAPAAAPNATTFDALFGPLTQTETFGQVWLNKDNKLQRVRLRLGISDGQQTELIEVLDGELQEGTEVVTNVLTGAVRQVPTPQGGAGFPGMGGRQGFPGGGNRGGGGRGGG